MMDDPKQWRCFHCDEVFTDKFEARDHFGAEATVIEKAIAAVRGLFPTEWGSAPPSAQFRVTEYQLGVLDSVRALEALAPAAHHLATVHPTQVFFYDAQTEWEITEAMILRGGSFVSCLGELFRKADPDNKRKIVAAFPEYFEEYRQTAAPPAAQKE